MRASLWLLLSLFVTAISWIYVTTVAAPWEHYVNVERGPMKAQMGDLYPSWYGTRELLYRFFLHYSRRNDTLTKIHRFHLRFQGWYEPIFALIDGVATGVTESQADGAWLPVDRGWAVEAAVKNNAPTGILIRA